jgi:hypothetical protein
MTAISRTSVACRLAASAALALFLGACVGTRTVTDPVLELRSASGAELGIATDYGLVFLGRSARSGEVEVTAWFGDGPSIETAVVEPLGGGLYTAETEIRLPAVPLSFDSPKAGDTVLVVGRRGREVWEDNATVRTDPRVRGLLLNWEGHLENAPDQVGAGVFVVDEKEHRRLVGLVSGHLELVSADGTRTRYITAVGPEELWRLVTYKRDNSRKRRWVYREDIL